MSVIDPKRMSLRLSLGRATVSVATFLFEGGQMSTQQDVSDHYTRGDLVAAIRGGVEALGKTIDTITIDDLAPVDEYHIGGRQASEDFLSQLNLTPEKHVLGGIRASARGWRGSTSRKIPN